MAIKKTVAFGLVLIFLAAVSFAQDNPDESKYQFPVELTFINQAVSDDMDSIPFVGKIMQILHPGFSLGTEYAYLQNLHHRIFQNFQAGYYFNEYAAKALFFQTAFGYRYTLDFGLFTDASAGLGYLHSFHPVEVWKLNSQGEYELAKDKGRGAMTIALALGIGYDFCPALGWPVSVFVRYQPYGQTRYSEFDSWLLQAWLQFGIRIQLW